MRPSEYRRLAGQEPGYSQPTGVPRVIIAMLALFALAFAIRFGVPAGLYDQFMRAFAVIPGRLVSTSPGDVPGVVHELLTFITHAFLHADFGHVMFNGLWLLIFGTLIASRFHAERWHGTIIFLAFYLSAAVFSGIFFVFLSLGQNVLLIGASGALSAMMAGAARVSFRRLPLPGGGLAPVLPLFDRRVVGVTLVYILLNLAVMTPLGGMLFMTSNPQSVAWEVHIAGFLYGLVMMPFFDRLAGNVPVRF